MKRKENAERRRTKRRFVAETTVRRRVLLALGWYDYQVNLGVAAFAHKANWIINDMAGHTHEIPLFWKCDGILISLPPHKPSVSQQALLARKLPTVDLRQESPLPLPRVVVDNQAIGRIAAEHLLASGFMHLGYYQAYAGQVEEDRKAGFRHAVELAGRTFHHIDLSRVQPRYRQGEARLAYLAERIRELPTPIGIMSQYDGSASELALACERGDRLVPEQVAIVGADNDPIGAELGLIPLTSVDTDRYQHGYEAAALLERLMNGEPPPEQVIRIPPKGIVIRRSSDIIAVSNTSVARALSFIRTHYREPIQVDDIVTASGSTRRTLFLAFRKHLGNTVMDTVHRLRIASAQQLLAETDDKTFSVALDCGYNDARHLNKNFQHLVGMTPSQYRRKKRK